MDNHSQQSLSQLILDRVLQRYYIESHCQTQRLGQFYVNHYVSGTEKPWPELFYEESLQRCVDIIAQHLRDKTEDDEEE